MTYRNRQKKVSGFTKYNSVELNDRSSGLKNGGNATWPIQAVIDKVAEVYGASMRVYQYESEMVVDDIQTGEYAFVEENLMGFYRITNDAATAPNVALDSGLTAKRIPSVTGDRAALGGLGIWPTSEIVSAQIGDTLPAGTKYLRDASQFALYILDGGASGAISALDFTAKTATINGVPYVLDKVIVPSNRDINVEEFSTGSAESDTNMLASAFAYASANGKNIVAPPGKTYVIDTAISATFENVEINFNGSVIKVTAGIQGSAAAVGINVSKFASVRNLEVDGDSLANRPLEIYGTTDYTNIVTDNLTVRNTFGIGVGTLAVCGVRIVGTGASIKMNNTNVFEVDSDVGRSNTQGIIAGRGSTDTEGYRNIEITNTYLRNITEAGGTAVLDSDGIKVFGYARLASENKTNCVINNVTQINVSGKSCKRIIKTQASTYTVKNIIGKFSDCDMFAPIDNQYGAGVCDSVDLSLDNVNIVSTLIGTPQFSSNTGVPNDSGSTAQNINVNAKNGSTCQFLTTAFLSEGDRVISRLYRNWAISGLSYTSFGVISVDNDDSFSEYRNINLSKSTATSDFFLQGTDASAPLQINYINAVFENVLTDRVLKSVGLYASNTTVWTRITPVSSVNSTIQFSGHIGRGGCINRPETINGVAKYTARTATDLPVGVGRTVIKINDDDIPAGKWGYQFIKFVYKSIKSGVNISNVAFTVTWDSATTVTIYELVESNVGVAQLKTPSASYNSGTGELEITFATDPTTQQQAFVDIESTVDFTVTTLFNQGV